jgi:hypothetical protein
VVLEILLNVKWLATFESMVIEPVEKRTLFEPSTTVSPPAFGCDQAPRSKPIENDRPTIERLQENLRNAASAIGDVCEIAVPGVPIKHFSTGGASGEGTDVSIILNVNNARDVAVALTDCAAIRANAGDANCTVKRDQTSARRLSLVASRRQEYRPLGASLKSPRLLYASCRSPKRFSCPEEIHTVNRRFFWTMMPKARSFFGIFRAAPQQRAPPLRHFRDFLPPSPPGRRLPTSGRADPRQRSARELLRDIRQVLREVHFLDKTGVPDPVKATAALRSAR